MSAPADFSETTDASAGSVTRSFPLSRFWMEQGVAVGLTLAFLGLGSLVDLNGLEDLLVRGMRATPVVVAIVALGASAVWLSRTADEAT